ncbi:MAG: hypothetical protein F6K31_11275 [Symploca sp. SIO2G7]|nr:hypothetical protein [Symploca sp. SIO2G7]
MSNSSPPEPPSSRRKILSWDEWIAIIVAFTTIIFIFFWVLGRRDGAFSFKDSLFTLKSPKPVSLPTTPGEETVSPPAIPGLDSDNELLTLPEITASLDSDSESSDSDLSTSPETTASLDSESEPLDSELLTSPEATSDTTPQESAPESEDTGPTVASPPAIAPTASPTASPTPPAEAIEFSDVPEDYWANHFIIILSEQQIIRGFPDQSFKPNQPVTRAELAAIIQNVFDKDDSKNPIDFEDLPADYWASPAIDKAVKTGFMKGYPGEVFRPDEQVPRVQVLVALISGLEATPSSTPEETLDIYQDKEQIPKWAIEKIAAATKSGLVVNHPNPESFNPNRPATRAEVAAMIYQALVISGRAEEYSSEYIIPPTE